jgi:lysozyme
MFTKQILVAGLALGAGACSTGSGDTLAVADQAISNAPGIDVSQFQGAIDWSQVRAAGTQFAFIKSGGMFTSGSTYTDPSFATNWSQARAAGVIRGAYYYFQPAFDGVTQGNSLVSQINAVGGLQTGDLPPAIDIELNSGNTVWDPVMANNLTHLQQWLTTVQNAFGKKPYIYTNQSTWQFLGNPQTFSGYPLWVANPGSASPAMPAGGWPTWTFWQNRVESGGVGTVTGMPQASGLDHDLYTGLCDNNVAVGATACASQGDSVQYRCQFGSTPGASLWAPESCNGGICSGSSCTSSSIPPCGTGLFCAGNQIPGSSACTANAQTIFCCPSGQTIVNGACSGTSGTCNGTVAAGNWTGRYWNNTSLSGNPVLTRDDGAGSLNFDWGTGSPGAGCGVPVDNFSARWTRSVSLAAGTYRFSATADDGVRLWVDGVLRIDRWIDQGPTTYTADVTLGAGSHNLQMDYYEHGGGAVARLSWSAIASTSPFCSANCGGGGWWCANDGSCIVNGVAGHNYHCAGNNVAPDRDQACASGCVIAPAGTPDYCQATSFCGGGAWCGNDCVNGYPRTLYSFTSSGAISSVTQCETGFASQTCTIAPSGSPDHCN